MACIKCSKFFCICKSSLSDDDEDNEVVELGRFGLTYDFSIAEYPKLYLKKRENQPQLQQQREIATGSKPAAAVAAPAAAASVKETPKESPINDEQVDQQVEQDYEDEEIILWLELEHFLRQVPNPSSSLVTLSTQLVCQARAQKLAILQYKIAKELHYRSARRRRKHAARRNCYNVRKLLNIMYQVILNEYGTLKKHMLTRQEYFAIKRPYSIKEHWDSDDETYKHSIVNVQHSHSEWIESEKEALRLRREDRIRRMQAPKQFWIHFRSRICRTVLFCLVLYAFAAVVIYLVQNEFAILEKQVTEAKEVGAVLKKVNLKTF